MLGFSLEIAGYQVVEAGSSAQAIFMLNADSFKVVLLDMGMPPNEHTPKEGLIVLDWLTQHQPMVRVVVLTGQDADSVSYLALKHGAFDFLEKPISSALLLSAIKRAELFSLQAEKLKKQEGLQRLQVDAIEGEGVKSIRNQAERKLVKQVLDDTEFNVHESARRLGLKRENMYYLIKKYGFKRFDSNSA
ncbi:MAG: response regulator [Gammaproteobacteria bacterium]|nr:response regulator [Gammaproteobacteria bacterium]